MTLSSMKHIVPLICIIAGVIGAAARAEIELAHVNERVEKLEIKQDQLDREIRSSIGKIQLNIARICLRVDAGCQE